MLERIFKQKPATIVNVTDDHGRDRGQMEYVSGMELRVGQSIKVVGIDGGTIRVAVFGGNLSSPSRASLLRLNQAYAEDEVLTISEVRSA